jgi:hypothetical protein
MRTYPIRRSDGSLLGFEIPNWSVRLHTVVKVLASVPGVENVRRIRSSENRVSFAYLTVACVVNEPWGDSSRFWIGPEAPEQSQIDMLPVHDAFTKYHGVARKALGHLLRQSDA